MLPHSKLDIFDNGEYAKASNGILLCTKFLLPTYSRSNTLRRTHWTMVRVTHEVFLYQLTQLNKDSPSN